MTPDDKKRAWVGGGLVAIVALGILIGATGQHDDPTAAASPSVTSSTSTTTPSSIADCGIEYGALQAAGPGEEAELYLAYSDCLDGNAGTPTSTPSETPTTDYEYSVLDEDAGNLPTVDPSGKPITLLGYDYDCEPDEPDPDTNTARLTMKQVWVEDDIGCHHAVLIGTALTPLQTKALGTAGKKKDQTHWLVALYDICGQAGLEAPLGAEDDSAADTKEKAGALVLCPKHPLVADRKAVLAEAKLRAKEAKLRAKGDLLDDGLYRVGKGDDQIRPGTYVATDVNGCYWERQNRNGETIANYFTNHAKRVQVTVRSSDYAFSSDGCDTWRRQR